MVSQIVRTPAVISAKLYAVSVGNSCYILVGNQQVVRLTVPMQFSTLSYLQTQEKEFSSEVSLVQHRQQFNYVISSMHPLISITAANSQILYITN